MGRTLVSISNITTQSRSSRTTIPVTTVSDVSVSLCCHNKGSQTGGGWGCLNNTNLLSHCSGGWKSESWVSQGWLLLRTVWEKLPMPLSQLPVAWSIVWLVDNILIGLDIISPLYVSLSLHMDFFHKDPSHNELGTHPTQLWPYLNRLPRSYFQIRSHWGARWGEL